MLYHSPLFSLVVTNLNEETKKFGVIVSKKIDSRAVERNRIRRLISTALQKSWDDFKDGIKAVFLVKKAILNKSLEEINSEVQKIAKEIK